MSIKKMSVTKKIAWLVFWVAVGSFVVVSYLPLFKGLYHSAIGGSGRDVSFDLSPDGKTIVFPGTGKGVRDLYLLDLSSKKVTRLTESEGWETNPRFSPDGRFVVYSVWNNPKETDHYWHLYLLDLKTRQTKQLTHGLLSDSNPQFTADGGYLIFSRATRLRNYSMGGKVWSDGRVCAMNLRDKNREIIELPIKALSASIRRDGKTIVFSGWVIGENASKNSYILVDLMSFLKGGKLKTVPFPDYKDKSGNVLDFGEPVWTSDGKDVAFVCWNKSNQRDELWLAKDDGVIAEQLTQLRSHLECLRFAPDNKTIYFLKIETDLMTMKNGIWKVNKNKECSQVADYTLFDNPMKWKPKTKR